MKTRGIVRQTGKSKYSFFIRIEGDERYFNTKFEPKCSEGDEVGIEFEPKGPERANIKKVVVLNAGARPPSTSSYGSSGGSSGGGAVTDRQASIVWQHSQEIACRLLDALIGSGALKVPAKAGEEVVLAKFDELTVRAYKDAVDPASSEPAKAASEAEAELETAEDTGGDWGAAEAEGGDDSDWGDGGGWTD